MSKSISRCQFYVDLLYRFAFSKVENMIWKREFLVRISAAFLPSMFFTQLKSEICHFRDIQIFISKCVQFRTVQIFVGNMIKSKSFIVRMVFFQFAFPACHIQMIHVPQPGTAFVQVLTWHLEGYAQWVTTAHKDPLTQHDVTAANTVKPLVLLYPQVWLCFCSKPHSFHFITDLLYFTLYPTILTFNNPEKKTF